MSWISKFRNVSEADKARAVEKLIQMSTPDFDFFLMIGLSFLMATFGLLIDSSEVIIGSMLIAPILHPVLSISLSMVMSDYKLLARSLSTLGKSIVFGVVAAIVATLFLSPGAVPLTTEALARTEPTLIYFMVAVVAGIAASYSLVKGGLSEHLPGIAVSVALLPPLAVVGIGVAHLNWSVISGATMLFLINIIGIVFASMVSFSLMNLYGKRTVAKRTVEKEEQRVEHETRRAEEKDNEVEKGSEEHTD